MKRDGIRHLCNLPDGYDGRYRIVGAGDTLLVAHPEKEPLCINTRTGEITVIKSEGQATPRAIGRAAWRIRRAQSRGVQYGKRRGMEFFVPFVLAILVVVTIIGVIAWATL